MVAKYLYVITFFTIPFILNAQDMNIMTYNVENLFDVKHDTLKNDRDFTPNSDLKWSNSRFYDKIHNVMQVILGVGGEEPPLLVGLCEVENDYVLKAMTTFSPYNQLNYGYVHYESPDSRGIDVAVLYQKDKFFPISSRPVPVILPNGKKGRDLLYLCGSLVDGTILHIIQVHFPSRREGALASQPNRIAAAKVVTQIVDSIKNITPNYGIIIMGDFNDNPSDYVPTTAISALPYIGNNFQNNFLYNLCWDGYYYEDRKEGSYFHNGQWDMLDQIIVSGSLLNDSMSISFNPKAQIYNPEWITKKDKRTGEFVPKRTYAGPHYRGGVSDHFPVYIQIKKSFNR